MLQKDQTLDEDLHQVYAAGIRARDLVMQILNFARKTEEEGKTGSYRYCRQGGSKVPPFNDSSLC